jgi:hypothetical protein
MARLDQVFCEKTTTLKEPLTTSYEISNLKHFKGEGFVNACKEDNIISQTLEHRVF